MKSIDGRRTVLKQGAALGAAVALGPVGLGSARAVNELRVVWADGVEQVLGRISADQLLELQAP